MSEAYLDGQWSHASHFVSKPPPLLQRTRILVPDNNRELWSHNCVEVLFISVVVDACVINVDFEIASMVILMKGLVRCSIPEAAEGLESKMYSSDTLL